VNVSVVENPFQVVRSESFALEPGTPVHESRSPVEEKRIHRFLGERRHCASYLFGRGRAIAPSR
jgi:hypothetical protein